MHIPNNDIAPATSHNCVWHPITNKVFSLNCWHYSLIYKRTCSHLIIFPSLTAGNKPPCCYSPTLSHPTPCTRTNSIYVLLIPLLLLLQLNPICKVSLQSTYQISCPFSSAQVVPKDQSRYKARVPFRTKARFYVEELLAPRPNPQLEDHPLSSFRDCFSIFSQQHTKLDTVPRSSPWGRAVPCWQGPALPCHYTCLTCTGQWSWLRHCATSRKVAGSIPDGVIGIFHWHNPSDPTMALGPTQPVTDMSTRIKLN